MSTDPKSQIDVELGKAYWPWSLALAYAQPKGIRNIALSAVVEVMQKGAAGNPVFQRYLGEESVKAVFAAATESPSAEIEWDRFQEIEERLVGLVRAEKLQAVGKRVPDGRFEAIPSTDWIGAEVDGDRTCDLVAGGWRSRGYEQQAFDNDRLTLFYDVHLRGAEVRLFVGGSTEVQAPQPQYLIPVHPEQVHPSVTLGDAVEDWLRAVGVDQWRMPDGNLRRGMVFSEITSRPAEEKGVDREVVFTASARKVLAFDVLARAANLFTEALFYGRLSAFVQDPATREYGQLPRDYWQEVDIERHGSDPAELVAKQSAEVPDALLGQRILLERQAVDQWTTTHLDALTQTLAGLVEPVKGEAARKAATRSRNRTGPKRKPARIRAALEPLFRQHYARLRNLSQREKHALLKRHWPNDAMIPLPAVSTIESHFSKWVDANAPRGK